MDYSNFREFVMIPKDIDWLQCPLETDLIVQRLALGIPTINHINGQRTNNEPEEEARTI
jgi:hypothetical protein